MMNVLISNVHVSLRENVQQWFKQEYHWNILYRLCLDVYSIHTVLTVHVFTNVSHPWGGSRGHVAPLEISLKDHGVVDHHRLREIVSG